ncbi:imelysin family protein [uncultured Polaribacter sp.]|uniref:imelysin family protein n=1 Tax=uncultured Polaribacter sp. TaxID=174711 RepID=UPI002614BE59|nr:imelysin family protein [uncultured Polaribacter sp.]
MTCFFASCKSDSAVEDCTNDAFDRGALLTNWADNIIIPSYELYVDELSSYKTAVATFVATPDIQNLEVVRTAWITAYTVWQNVSIYEIGQAELKNMRDYTNTFPVNTVLVESNISTGNYDLSLSTNLDAQGFPAVDYLLNGVGTTDAEIIAVYATNGNAANYKTYLSDVSERLLSMGNEILSDWKGSYRDIFISNDCASSTASLDKLTNDMIFNIEKVTRVAKIGIPIDFFGQPPVIAPEKVEAVYKQDISKTLLIASIQASQDLFNGKHVNSDTEGESLKSYLDELQIEAGGKLLSAVINERYDAAMTQAETLDANFYLGMQNDREKYKVTRDKIHKIIEVLKTNMISALGIKADYNDSDGD